MGGGAWKVWAAIGGLAVALIVAVALMMPGAQAPMPSPVPGYDVPFQQSQAPQPAPTPVPGQIAAAPLSFPNGPPPPVDLNIPNLRQETMVWCWAAVAQQIIHATKGAQQTPQQCALVAIANGAAPEFCCNGQNPQCVRTGAIPQIQQLIQQFGGRTSTYVPAADPMTLYNTLRSGHAVILGLRSQQMGHVVVVRGMSFAPTQGGWEPVLHLNDPMAQFTQPVPFRQIAPMWSEAIVVN